MPSPVTLTIAVIVAYLLASSDAVAQLDASTLQKPSARPAPAPVVRPVDASLVYEGSRSRLLLGRNVAAKGDGRVVGTLRDIVIDAGGRAAGLVVAAGESTTLPEIVVRQPWTAIDRPLRGNDMRIDLAKGAEQPQLGLIPGLEGAPTLPREFRLSQLLGDPVRLLSGEGFGLVTDVILSGDGRIGAVLVTRDAASGDGTVAFPFYGTSGTWDPDLSSYGLPFATEVEARGGALPIDHQRFRDAGF